jgi:protein disulfide-isomerase A1
MHLSKPLLPLLLSLLLLSQTLAKSIPSLADENLDWSEEDDEEFDSLLAIDDSEEGGGAATSEPQLLRKAQKIVTDLNNDNSRRVVEENELVLLLGYAPWDKKSAALMPRFAQAATELREMGSPVVMAKVDAERYPKVASLYGIKGFPTFLLFVNGTSQRYSGGIIGDEIVIWVRKKTGVPVIRLSSEDSAKQFLKKYKKYAIGLFENYEGPESEAFAKAALTNNETQFVATDNFEIAKLLYPQISSKKNFVGLVKTENDKFEKFEGKFEEGEILDFVEKNKFPLVSVLTEEYSGWIYSSPIKIQVYVFAEEDDFEGDKPFVEEVARKFKTKVMFVYVDSTEEDLAKPFFSLFGTEPDDTLVTAFDNRNPSKHLMEKKLTKANLEEFCLALEQGILPPFLKSEPIPKEKGLIEKVVSKNFEAAVLESPDNVFLEVYAPNCVECDSTTKVVEKAAKHFEGNSNLKFARIDASSNEHPKLETSNYPALLFYPMGDKSNPIKVSKKSSFQDVINFINEKIGQGEETGAEKKDEL